MECIDTIKTLDDKDITIQLSLTDAIKNTNRCLYNWLNEASKNHSKIKHITNEDATGLFLNWFKKFLRSYVNDYTNLKRFLSYHRPFIKLNGETGQILNISFIDIKDSNHFLFDRIVNILSNINYSKLLYKEENNILSTNEIEGLSFYSIDNIKF